MLTFAVFDHLDSDGGPLGQFFEHRLRLIRGTLQCFAVVGRLVAEGVQEHDHRRRRGGVEPGGHVEVVVGRGLREIETRPAGSGLRGRRAGEERATEEADCERGKGSHLHGIHRVSWFGRFGSTDSVDLSRHDRLRRTPSSRSPSRPDHGPPGEAAAGAEAKVMGL